MSWSLPATRRPRHQRPVGVNLPAQQHYFGVSADKIASERSDHCNALDKLGVEGCKSIRDTAAGSGAGLGHRAVGCGSAFGAAAQPLSAIKISAVQSIAHRLRDGERIGYLLGLLCVGGFFCPSLLLDRERSRGTPGGSLGRAGLELFVRHLLGVQPPGLHHQQHAQRKCQRLEAVGFDFVEHGYTPSQAAYRQRLGSSSTVARTCARLMSKALAP